MASKEFLTKAYLAYFGRPMDKSGEIAFANATDAQVIKAFSESAESQALYAGKSGLQKINAYYQTVFGRESDLVGAQGWLAQVTAGTHTIDSVAIAIINAGLLTADKTSIENKLAASTAFTANLDTTAEAIAYSGTNAAAAGRAFLASVTATAATTAQVDAAIVASTNAAGTNEAGSSLVLTTGQDILTATSGNDNFRGVAGNSIVNQEATTLNSSDILDGGAGADALIVNLTGAYGGGARIKAIETLQLGSNVANASFDYNVNEGANEVTDVTKVVYDQINVGEALTVTNLIKTNGVLPTLAWYNDSATNTAGTAVATYRAAQVTGTADVQAVEFNNVAAGAAQAQLNIAGGIETAVLGTKTGSSAITLNNTGNADTTVFAAAADIISAGTLNRVELIGASVFGKAAGLVAATGLQDRNVANDGGITATATASNLLSVGARVVTVDASKLTADSNVRFSAKNDNSDSNVTFLGGTANDYVEFERGNVNADGGTGADTFSFVTQAAGITNSGFGSTDTIKGGTGADTVQIGLNGVGTYTLNTTEFNNKTGIETLDVRGQNNDITVSSEVVAAADVGKFTIRTDKMVQSAAGTADQTGGSTAEATSTSVINLTGLNQNQGIVVVGGSGSERVVVNNASLNAATEIDGGTNGGVAGRYDTLTILNTTVADAGDLANVKGIESIILTESVTGVSRFDITLTEAFLLNNTAAVNAVGTTIDDSVFRIGTAASSTGLAIVAGDVVTIDISGLLNAARTGLSANLTGRGVDVALGGATVNFVVDGAPASAAQIAFVTKADAARADAGVNSAAGVVIVPGVALSSTAAIITANATALTGGAATTDTLTVTDAGVVTVGSVTTALETLVLANGTNTVTFAQAGFTNVTGGTGNDTVSLANLALSASANLGSGNDTLSTAGTVTGSFDGGTGADNLNLTAAANLAGATVAGFETLTGAGTVSLTAEQLAGFTTAVNTAANLVTVTTAGTLSITGTATNFALANGTNDFTGNSAVAYNVTGGTGADTFNFTDVQAAAAAGIAGGTGTDTLNITGALTAATNISGVGYTGLDVVNFTGGTTATFIFTNTNGAGTLNFTKSAITNINNIVLGTGGQTLNVLGAGTGLSTITGGAGADTINLSATATGADTIVGTTSTFNAIDTIANFKATGADVITGLGTNAASLGNLTIASATTTTLAAAIQTATGGTFVADAAFLVSVAAGDAAGLYIYQNTDGAANVVNAADFIVKLTGTTGVIAVGDLLA
jgi:hypothetical protein